MLIMTYLTPNLTLSNLTLHILHFRDPESELAMESRHMEEFIAQETLGTISEIVGNDEVTL